MERSTITIDEFGNVILPNDITNVWMNESELLDLFNVTAPTIRAGIKALCKSSVLREYEKQIIGQVNNHKGSCVCICEF